MAQQIMCDMCEAEPARMMESDITDGTTHAIGQNCLFVYYASAAQALMPEPAPESEPEPEHEAPKTPRKRASKTKTEPLPPTEPVEEYPEVPPANMTKDTAGNNVPF